MNLPKTLAKNIMDFVNQQFWEHHPGSTDDKLYQLMTHNHLTGKFSVSWSEGGTQGDCWSDELTDIEAEHEPDMSRLLSFLTKYYPDLAEKQIAEILNLTEITIEEDCDWYGGTTSQTTKSIYFSEVINKLIEFKHSNEMQYVNLDTIIDYVKELVIDQSLHDYTKIKQLVDIKIDKVEVKKSLKF